MGRNLVLAPHPDDEILWCFSALNEDSKVLLFTQNERIAVSKQIAKDSGYVLQCEGLKDTQLPDHLRMLIAIIENAVEDGSYDNIYIPSHSDHQDHQAVHRAAMAALRPGRGVNARVLEYPYLGPSNFPANSYSWLPPMKMREKQMVLSRYQGKNMGYWIDAVLCWNTALAARFTMQGGMEPFNLLWEMV